MTTSAVDAPQMTSVFWNAATFTMTVVFDIATDTPPLSPVKMFTLAGELQRFSDASVTTVVGSWVAWNEFKIAADPASCNVTIGVAVLSLKVGNGIHRRFGISVEATASTSGGSMAVIAVNRDVKIAISLTRSSSAIVGGSVAGGVVLLLLGIVCCVVCWMRQRSRGKRANEMEPVARHPNPIHNLGYEQSSRTNDSSLVAPTAWFRGLWPPTAEVRHLREVS
jgi:hypothetical protein